MSIIFTDAELRTASKEYVEIPARQVLLDQQDAQTDDGQAEALAQDEANKVFYDNYLNITKRYHEELKNLNGAVKTDYSTTDLQAAAQISPGNIHFIISPPWVNFPPKVHASNLGSPASTIVADELDRIAVVQAAKDQLLSGFSDGGVTALLTMAYASGVFQIATASGITVGNRVVVSQAGVSAYGVVASVVTLLLFDTITITEIAAPSGSLAIGATVKNFDSGFSNAEREHTVASHAAEYQSYLEGVLDTEVSSIEVYLQAQNTALLANDAISPDKPEIDQAKLDVQDAVNAINAYQSAPNSGSGVGRFGDSILVPLQVILIIRAVQIPDRVLQISTRLGSISQAGNGTFTGSGQYHNLFKWVDLRLSKSGGSLTKYYSYNLIKSFIASTKSTFDNKYDEYGLAILAVKLTADAAGTQFVAVESTIGLSISDSVFLLDDDSGIVTLSTTIAGISGLVIELAVNASLFTTNKVARLVKYI